MSLVLRLHRTLGHLVSGQTVWERDWDILCVLDGCRVDTMRQFHDCESFRSVAAASPAWIQRNFGSRDLSSVGYVSANPFASDLNDDQFAYFHLEGVSEVDGVETVDPETLRNHAVSAWDQREGLGIDRLIVHFMQPHVPFRSRPEWFRSYSGTSVWGSEAWRRVGDDIPREEWMHAYADNLSWVLNDGVEPLRDLVDATVGVTADHGNAAGEWKLYGHPKGVATPEVRRVPWWSFEAESVDDIEAVDLVGEQLSDAQRGKQLAALGYKS